MTEDEKENFRRVNYRMKEEGFHYCFDGYSDWSEIKDEKFQELRENYLNSVIELKNYIKNKNSDND